MCAVSYIPRLLVLGMRLACCSCNPAPFLSVLQDHFLYLSVQDPHAPPPNGYNQEKSTSVWTNGGRHKVSQLSPHRTLRHDIVSPRSPQLFVSTNRNTLATAAKHVVEVALYPGLPSQLFSQPCQYEAIVEVCFN